MLDNIVGEELHSTAKALKDKWRGKREFLIETSGGIVEGGLVARLGPGEWLDRLTVKYAMEANDRYRYLVDVGSASGELSDRS